MKSVLKFKWPIAIGLIVLTVVLFLLAPNLTEQAEQAGSFQLSDEASSQIASRILTDADAADQTISLVMPLESELTDSMRETLEQMVADIEALGDPVTSVLNPVESEELEEQLISEDRQTVLMPVTVDGTDEEVNAVADTIRETIIPEDMTAYLTGEAIINNDVNISAQEGLKRTEIITVVLIFGLLLAVFRSIVTPFIPLVAVGISYLLSQSIVAFFIDWFGFPVSNYTQIFLVAILFGIGTDYCILLLSRYKEELSAGHGVEQSIINTYKTAGRTLLISGIAVFIGFFAIGFAEFPIFKSAVAVAVGIFVLLLVLYTIVPFFMSLLKEKLFWPSKKTASHSDSKLWINMSKLSINRPLLSMLVVAVITVPLLFTYDNDLSFNTVDEIGSEYESVKGLRAIEEGFGKGDSLPVQVIVKSDDALTDRSTVPYFEMLSKEIEKIDGVETVRSITRPTGDVIDELYVDEQLGLMADGLGEARDGLGEVQAGLTEVQTNLSAIADQAGNAGGLNEAAAGLGQINQQIGQVSQGLQVTGNIPQTVGALTQISGGLSEIQQGLAGAAGQTAELSAGLTQLAEGVGASNDGLAEIQNGLTEVVEMMQEMSDSEAVRDTGLFIPEGTLESEDFEQVLDRYSFADGTGMMMEVILSEDPYSHEAIGITSEIKETVERTAAGTPLEEAEIAFSGISSINSDLEEVSSNDFTNTVVIMLISLFVVLAILFRSLIMPLYMIGSLLLTYYTSISIAELIFVNGLGYDGISWAVPFFGFVMLVALGVDYSIFLLDRFREESFNGITVRDAMRTSMAKMGTVIITAAIILAGTFGAMMPSGVLSLVQIATIVITGLLLYGLIVLPLLIPAISVSFDRGVWWPFGKKK
ncbi:MULTISPECIES: MMPL family transporter [Planococcus]|uniref:MMPL family transporter n=1 Tax=Planococcus wigleyi TaxID=2762216 RepID=A0ABR8WE02_9BACL|nr:MULTISPECIES: MMPL family transporter [Planococcus]MBD8015263.1 MMPL family transporter [Planococcus wigleyi]MBF6633205.1 MMPL family transporter [Planococcus sp. (in: firmicutes)]MDN3439533.1 MMPL family transporter [Planococcus sp. APC 3900]